MVTTASAYSRGNQASLTNSFFGNSTSLGTFLRNTKDWRENMDQSIHLRLRNEDNIVCCIDNNQKGHNLKYQQFGQSNKYVKVTGCIIKKYHYLSGKNDYPTSKVNITYSSQAIPSPLGMPAFECATLTDDKLLQYFVSSFERNQPSTQQSLSIADVDFTGKRVESYASIIHCLETIQLIKQVIGSSYNKTSDKLKFVDFSPDSWQSPTIEHIIKYLSPLKRSLLFMKCNNFQNKIVSKWNPKYQSVSQFIVPKVFLHDEITTDGYGKCIIELLTMHRILIKTPIKENIFEWVLSENWRSKTIILFLDGLLLDRHRCFGNKLINLPMSFTQAYRQSLIFKDALSRVIEVSGPLHTAFHMMQSIFNVYRCVLKTIKDCIGWKKMKLNHVSENYRQCCSLLDMVYEEIFRILFFTFLSTLEEEQVMHSTSNDSIPRETYSISLSRKFDLYINNKIASTTDERLKIMMCFYKLTHLFKQYQKSMVSGDCIMMEKIEVDFCGIFLVLDKTNYVEIVLSQIEKRYKEVEYHQLQEIRINCTSRYECDPKDNKFYHSLHVLDETMENVNMWVKNLPLGEDQESWAMHSPNVTVAQRCRLFDQNEYKRGITNFEKLLYEGTEELRELNKNKYVLPKKIVEKKGYLNVSCYTSSKKLQRGKVLLEICTI